MPAKASCHMGAAQHVEPHGGDLGSDFSLRHATIGG